MVYSGRLFVLEHGIDDGWLHGRYHHHLDEKIIARNAGLIDLFSQLDLKHGLLTHSHTAWAVKALQHLGLKPWFADDCILGLEQYGFEEKFKGPTGFVKLAAILELDLCALLFVEDSLHNLKIPHRLGFTTVYLHHGRDTRSLPGFVDFTCANADALLQQCVQQIARPITRPGAAYTR